MSALDSSRDSQLRQGTKARHSNQFTSQVKTSNGHNATHYARNKPGALPTGGRKSSNLSKSSQASNSTQRSSHAAKTTHDGLPRNPRGAATTLQSAPDKTRSSLPDNIVPRARKSHAKRSAYSFSQLLAWWRDRKSKLSTKKRWVSRHPIFSVIASVILLTYGWSFVSFVSNSNNGQIPAAAAEWVRGHGGSSIVRWAENVWYSHHQPPKGGRPPKGAIPIPKKVVVSTTAPVNHLPMPPAIVPLASPPIAGEGQWSPAGRYVNGVPAVYETFLRPDPIHTSLVVGVAWMDTTLLRATLYSGSEIPGGGPWHYTAPILPADAQSLVAAFNSGFLMQDAQGGYYSEGKLMYPLVNGDASIVIYSNGDINIGSWGSQVSMTPNVVSVRQNLQLLVNNGAPVPGLNANDTTRWGLTLGNQIYVWRSGLGITADGALVYVGGPGLNITTLANLLVRAGAVRGMETDINTDWVNYSVYNPPPGQPAAPSNGTSLLPTMMGGPSRYFIDWPRDFLTMSARSIG